MLEALLLLAVLVAAPHSAGAVHPGVDATPTPATAPAPRGAATADETLKALFEGGRTFRDFLGAARRRTELWNRLAAEGTVAPEAVARARAVGGTWRILAVAEDWCGDSAHNIPYVAKLVEEVEGVELRIINSNAGRTLMEAHRTPDGRPATPTLILLDTAWNEVGCFVERPSPLMAWYMDNVADKSPDEVHEHVLDFYAADQGQATVEDVVQLLEAAAAGEPRCAVGAG